MNYCNCPNCRTVNCPAATADEALAQALALATELMRTCYDEANRLANHGSNGLEKRVMSQLYDAANAAKARLNVPHQPRADET